MRFTNKVAAITKLWMAATALFLFPILGLAQEEEKIKVRFRSRGLFDATLSDYDNGKLKSYYRVEDFRVMPPFFV